MIRRVPPGRGRNDAYSHTTLFEAIPAGDWPAAATYHPPFTSTNLETLRAMIDEHDYQLHMRKLCNAKNRISSARRR